MRTPSESEICSVADALLASAVHGNAEAVAEVAKLPAEAWPRGARAEVANAIRELERNGQQVEVSAIFAAAHKHSDLAGDMLGELTAVQPTCNPRREAKLLHDRYARHDFARKTRELSSIPADTPLEDYRHILEDIGLFDAFPGREDGLLAVDLTPWYTVAPPPLEFVFDGLVPRGTLIGIVAQGGMGKGWLTQELITSAAIGRELVQGFKPSGTMRVIWIESEDPSEEIQRRHAKIIRAFGINKAEHGLFAQNVRLYAGEGSHLVKVENGNVIPTDDYYKLQDIVREWKPDLIVIDPLSHFYGGDENDNVVMAGFMNHIRALAEESRTTVWVNHHVSKNLQDTLSTAMGRGASALRDALRSMFALAPLTDQEINEFGITDSSLYLRLGHTKTNWTRRTGNVTYLKRDVSTADVSGVLRVVDLESDEKVNAEEMLDRAAKKLAIIIGENPDDLTERRIAKTSEGADVRYELQKGFPKLATTRAIIKVLSRAEILGFLTMERKGKAKIPRKSNSASGGFGRESEQKCASEQEACSNTQGSEKKELTESVQTEQEKTCTYSHKVLSDNDL